MPAKNIFPPDFDGLTVDDSSSGRPASLRSSLPTAQVAFIQVIDSCRMVARLTQIRYGTWAQATQR